MQLSATAIAWLIIILGIIFPGIIITLIGFLLARRFGWTTKKRNIWLSAAAATYYMALGIWILHDVASIATLILHVVIGWPIIFYLLKTGLDAHMDINDAKVEAAKRKQNSKEIRR